MQFAAIVRARPFVWKRAKRALAIEIGTAFSTGPHNPFEIGLGESPEHKYRLNRAYWQQLEVGFELQARTGFHLITALGAAFLLNGDDAECEATVRPPESRDLPRARRGGRGGDTRCDRGRDVLRVGRRSKATRRRNSA
jgi:hypothetical protein